MSEEQEKQKAGMGDKLLENVMTKLMARVKMTPETVQDYLAAGERLLLEWHDFYHVRLPALEAKLGIEHEATDEVVQDG